jgi:hypothetical protein
MSRISLSEDDSREQHSEPICTFENELSVPRMRKSLFTRTFMVYRN